MDNDQLCILLVEDDEEDYLIIRDLLSEIQETKHALEWVPTFDAALDALAHRAHDVYLVDYRLGERDGLELLRHAQSQGCAAPIILLTGQGNRDVDLEAMKAGAADFLVVDRLHTFLINDPEVGECAARFLRDGRFRDADEPPPNERAEEMTNDEIRMSNETKK